MTEPKPNCQYQATCHAANCDGCENEHDKRVEALERELGALIAKYQSVLGENVIQARQLAKHDGHSEPPVVGSDKCSSTLKLVLTKTDWELGHYWPAGYWTEPWTGRRLAPVVTWWELPTVTPNG